MAVLCRLLVMMVLLSATLTFALPQHGEDLAFEEEEEQDASPRSISFVMVRTPFGYKRKLLRRTDDEDYEGSAMGEEEEGRHLYSAGAGNNKRRPLESREMYSVMADCPVDDLYTCGSGDAICGTQLCDGVADCPDWDDEADCDCEEDMFQCDGVVCIQNSLVCDGFEDCADGMDESNCGHSTTTTNPTTTTPNNTTTTTNTTASPTAPLINTTTTTMRPTTTTPNNTTTATTTTTTVTTTTAMPLCVDGAPRRPCHDGTTHACFCDGLRECGDGEDERLCYHGGCRPWQWRCRCDGSCIARHDVCNRRKDCPDGSDERGCVPGMEWWRCKCGGWIRMWQRCDRRRDCLDGSDERFCPHRHHCHGAHHWLFSRSARQRLQHLLVPFDGDDIVDTNEDLNRVARWPIFRPNP